MTRRRGTRADENLVGEGAAGSVGTMARVRLLLPLLALAAGLLACPQPASARKSADYVHRYEQVWSASVRMVRVDLRFRIQDQDASIGYLLFDYRDTNGRTTPGSVELVRAEEEGRPVVRVVIQIPAKPSYIEQMLLDRLRRKLTEEFGQPPPPPRRPAQPPADDGDDDGNDAPDEAPDEGAEPPRR